MRFRLINNTIWNSKQIKRVVDLCLHRQAEGTGRRYRAEVVYARQRRGCTGYAYLNSGLFRVRVPGPDQRFFDRKLLRDFIGVTLHEIDHTLGVGHADMGQHSPHDLSMFEQAIDEVMTQLGPDFTILPSDPWKPRPGAPTEKALRAIKAIFDGLRNGLTGSDDHGRMAA